MQSLYRLFYLMAILIIPFFSLSATFQELDILIYNNDTTYLQSYPLESIINDSIFPERKNWECTANWRGYQAVWEIKENKLYLTAINGPCGNPTKLHLEKLFGEKIKNKKVFADWYNGELLILRGKTKVSSRLSRMIAEQEDVLQISGGVIIDSASFENIVYESVFERNPDSLMKYIYSHIRWDSLPIQKDDSIRIVAMFSSSNLDKKVDSVKIIKGDGVVYQEEVIRVIKSLPECPILFVRGKFIPVNYVVPVIFTYSNFEKYKAAD